MNFVIKTDMKGDGTKLALGKKKFCMQFGVCGKIAPKVFCKVV